MNAKVIKGIVSILLVAVGMSLLAGCGTINGFGSDVSYTGRQIERV